MVDMFPEDMNSRMAFTLTVGCVPLANCCTPALEESCSFESLDKKENPLVLGENIIEPRACLFVVFPMFVSDMANEVAVVVCDIALTDVDADCRELPNDLYVAVEINDDPASEDTRIRNAVPLVAASKSKKSTSKDVYPVYDERTMSN
jgi:hypothetical protein